ncbi:uncharacterized protein Gasu_05970 [Galdieria sulphuraria]|uniref:Uncharacterized protein n=1 Tax=Galdieria sulphuraria TaxID=130081 RepID=M2Y8L5_GALSU|nr:uncharacterized protein Gasu_05970 [Galdieria sulphuraria]EME32184.1 hypothetical protein Gasu_05970 [Galdieria sulphuraria]|eukprot:XP_005708704.1 hypothetical protein Gasu_05970 [Galdieria sulphuraria]
MDDFDVDTDLCINEMYNFYSNLEEVADDVSLDEEVLEEEDEDQDNLVSNSETLKGFERYSLRMLSKTDRDYFLARFFPEDLPTVQSSLLRIYRQGEDTVEARREELAAERKFLKEQQTFLACRRARRQASEGVVKLPPRSRKRWCIECGSKQNSGAQANEDNNVKKFSGSLEGESSATYALFILDDERNEADFVTLDKYCRYHFRSLLPAERTNELDVEEAERKIQRQNRAEQKEWERLPTKDNLSITKGEAVPLASESGSLLSYSSKASFVDTPQSSSLQNDGVIRKSLKRTKTSEENEDLDYEVTFEDDDVSLGEEVEEVQEHEEERGLSEDESEVGQKEFLKDRSSGVSTKSSPYRKRSRLEEAASVGSASPSALSSSDSDNEDMPNLSHSGKEIKRLLKKEKVVTDSESSTKKRRVLNNNSSNEKSPELETIVRDILWDSCLKKTPLSLREFTSLVTQKWPNLQKSRKALDPQLLELIKSYTEQQTDDSESPNKHIFM